MSATRELVYPNYTVKAHETGDIFLRFVVPGSNYGPVQVVLVRDDADALLSLLDKAVAESFAVGGAAGSGADGETP